MTLGHAVVVDHYVYLRYVRPSKESTVMTESVN